MQRLTGIGVSPGVVVGRARHPDPARAGARATTSRRARVDRELARLDESRGALARAARATSGRASPRRAGRAGVALRRAAADARRPDAGAARRRRSSATSASTPSGPCSRSFDEFSAVFDEVADPYLRERKGDVADLVGRLQHEPAPGGDAARPAAASSTSVGADRRRADAVAGRAGRLDEGARLRDRRRQPDLSHRDPGALARRAGGRRPARRQRARSSRAQLVVIDGTTGEVIVDPDAERAGAASSAAAATTPRRAVARRDARRSPAVTADGVRIRLDANIEFPDDRGARALRRRRRHRAVPIGVPARRRPDRRRSTRTRSTQVYRRMLEGMAPGRSPSARSTSTRISWLARSTARRGGRTATRGSRQGLRGLRLSLRARELFQTQLRALLRAARARPAAHHVPVRVRRRAGARGARGWSPRRPRRCARAATRSPHVPSAS